MKTIWLGLAAALTALSAIPAHATVFTFDITYWETGGDAPPADTPVDYTAHFTVDDQYGGLTNNGFWSYADGHIFDFPLFDGTSSHAAIFFYSGANGGGLSLIPYIMTPNGIGTGDEEIDIAGPALFTSDAGGNHLQIGTYDMLWYGGDASDGQFRLSISEPVTAVPEPAAWAMILGGFALAGAVLRKHKRTTTRFA